jgi:hypothetical protein
MKMYSQDWSQIAALCWVATATGINLDWCLTTGIKQKATSVRLCIPSMEQKILGSCVYDKFWPYGNLGPLALKNDKVEFFNLST